MIILDKKSYDLLFYLLKLTEPETIMVISRTLGQSRRKIYYHLEKINDALPKDIAPIVAYPRVGILLTDEQKTACRRLIDEFGTFSYVMNATERLQLILLYIAVSMERVTIERLMQLTDVSRNTTLNDLNEVRRQLELEPYTIHLQVTKAKGYYLDCHPLSKIQFLYKLLKTIDSQGNASFTQFIYEQLQMRSGVENHFSKPIQEYFDNYFLEFQGDLGKKINRQESQFLLNNLPYILLAYRNIDLTPEIRQEILEDFTMILERKEYLLACQLAEDVKAKFQVVLDDIEIGFIAVLLLSFRKDRDSHLESQDYDEMRLTIGLFLESLVERYGLTFYNLSELQRQLLTHCKALLYRKTYGITSFNPLTQHIIEKYTELFAMTKSCIGVLEEAWLIRLTDDEIAYLTIHLGGELYQSQGSATRQRMAVVCDEGIAIQKLLLRQCQQYLPEVDIEAVLTTEQFESVRDLMVVEGIITTSDGLDSPFPFVVVSPLLTEEDIIRLLRLSRGKMREQSQAFEQALATAIARYVKDDTEAQALKATIEKLIYQDILMDIIPHRY